MIGSVRRVAIENQAGRRPVSKSRTPLPAGMGSPLITDGTGFAVAAA